MSNVTLLLAPAAAGKTEYLIHHVRQKHGGLGQPARVCVASQLQVLSWRRRLAAAGGAIGIEVITFNQLVGHCLAAVGQAFTRLDDPVQFRLLRAVVDGTDLTHYHPLKPRPGFIQVLRRLIHDLKTAQLSAGEFQQAVNAATAEPRLLELARLYRGYQHWLKQRGWADDPGLNWLAIEALGQNTQAIAASWPLLAFDGFTDFTTVQLSLLEILARQPAETIITLTGAAEPRIAHSRFQNTRRQLEIRLGITARPLPRPPVAPTMFTHLEQSLFAPRQKSHSIPDNNNLTLLEAPDRIAEVRNALRWLKQRIVEDGVAPGQAALLARNISPYRPYLRQVAAEFGMPIHLLAGIPLRQNPAVTALLGLLSLALPDESGLPAVPRRPLLDAWRSPYFNWQAAGMELEPGDADWLDAAARTGQVIGGVAEWEETLSALARITTNPAEEGDPLPAQQSVGHLAERLLKAFHQFIKRITAPAKNNTYRDHVRWLEAFIGEDPTTGAAMSLTTVSPDDTQALFRFKDVLRGLVWAEEMLGAAETIDFSHFLQELHSAIEAASFQPHHPDQDSGGRILVAGVLEARGVPFEAVAVLGLAEGEFPATLREDPFLREADRAELNRAGDLELDSALLSAEREFFYETVTRASRFLLLTRPRMADNSAEWQPSPYWEEVLELSHLQPLTLTSESRPAPAEAASWTELLESLAAETPEPAAFSWVDSRQPKLLPALQAAADMFSLRTHPMARTIFDGHLVELAADFTDRFAPQNPWSASRLESYRTCPYMFFVATVLRLEPRTAPATRLEAWQLGNIYHNIFQAIYQNTPNPDDTEAVLAGLEQIAGAVLDDAPQQQGFRVTAWWEQSKAEIVNNVRESVLALAELPGDFTPIFFEQGFFREKALTITNPANGDSFRIHGVIDRVDRDDNNRLRIIDYKTGGPYAFSRAAVAAGKKIQLPLYALAARDALNLGEPAEGFYWHIRHIKPSDFRLSRFDGGPQAAYETAIGYAWEVVNCARNGQFTPQPPGGGCPSFCPAAAFCWHYQPGS
jgi:ATP-dependent helicase/DNAse subunit B